MWLGVVSEVEYATSIGPRVAFPVRSPKARGVRVPRVPQARWLSGNTLGIRPTGEVLIQLAWLDVPAIVCWCWQELVEVFLAYGARGNHARHRRRWSDQLPSPVL